MKISKAYDAFWFLTEHPKMKCRDAILISESEAATLKLSPGERVKKLRDEMPWLKDKTYLIHDLNSHRESFSCNLSIFWAKVDKRGKVNDDKKQNVTPECWLEFGPIKQAVSDGNLDVMHYHDPRLDCGAPTFDQALVKLARLVRKYYGDIKTPAWCK